MPQPTAADVGHAGELRSVLRDPIAGGVYKRWTGAARARGVHDGMGTWLDEPGAREWREAVDAADRLRGPQVPIGELPCFLEGRAALEEAVRLVADPEAPGATTAARSAIRRALALIPQSRPDQLCYEERWRQRHRWDGPPEVCSRRTCGRCVPLKAAADRARVAGG